MKSENNIESITERVGLNLTAFGNTGRNRVFTALLSITMGLWKGRVGASISQSTPVCFSADTAGESEFNNRRRVCLFFRIYLCQLRPSAQTSYLGREIQQNYWHDIMVKSNYLKIHARSLHWPGWRNSAFRLSVTLPPGFSSWSAVW